jgi:hypothetical protein
MTASDIGRDRAPWLLLGLAVLLGAAFPYFERMMNANERPRLLQAMAWIDDGSSAIDGPAARGIPAGIDVARGANGRLYPNKPPGATVPAAAAYLVLKAAPGTPTLRGYTFIARMLGGWLPTLVLLGFAWGRLAPRFGPRAAVFALVAYTLATPVMSYARLLFGHQLAACLLFVGVVWTVEAIADRNPGRAALGGAIASAAVVVEYFAAFAGLPLAVLVALRLRDPRSRATAAAAVAGALGPMLALALYHALVFGSPWATPYHSVVSDEFASTHAHGLLGLSWPTSSSAFEHLLSPWGGLMLWAPLTVLAVAALVRAEREGSATSLDRVCLATFAIVALLSLGLQQTGGWRVGPRYVVAVLPFTLPGLALLHGWMRVRVVHVIVVALGLVSVLFNALAATLFPHLVPGGNPLTDLLLPLFADGREPHGPLAAVGLFGVTAPAILIAALAVFVWSAQIEGRRRQLALGGLLAIALFVGLLALPSAPDAEERLSAVTRIWEPVPGVPLPPSPAL